MKNIKKIDPVILHSNYENRPFSMDITYQPNGVAKPVIMHVHGFKGFKDWGYFNLLAEYAAHKGFVFVKMNFSHNGTTPENPVDFVDLEAFGNNNFSIEQDDMGKVIDFIFSIDFPVEKNELNLDRFFLTGHSRGGAAVILKGFHDDRVKAIASWAGINDLGSHYTPNEVQEWKEKGVMYIENSRTKQLMPLYFQIVEDYIKNERKLKVPYAIRKIDKPLLVVHGTDDPTVPVQVAYQTIGWNPGAKLFIVTGANHVFGGGHPWNSNTLPKDARQVINRTLLFFESV
jgi:dipeptidyl aminopeptidase/acylaminoacyl peptidase